MLICIRIFGRGGGYTDMYTVSTLRDREPGPFPCSLSMLCDLMQSVAMEVMQGRNVQEQP